MEILELAQIILQVAGKTCVLKEMVAKKAQEFAKKAAEAIQSADVDDADEKIYEILAEITGLDKKFIEENLSIDHIFRIFEVQSILNGIDREKKSNLLRQDAGKK